MASSTPLAPARSTSPEPDRDAARPRDRLAVAGAALALTVLFASLFTLRTGLAAAERGLPFAWGRELTVVLVHWCASLAFVPLLDRIVRRGATADTRWLSHVPAVVAGAAVLSVVRSLLDQPVAALLGQPMPPLLRGTRIAASLGAFLAIAIMLHALHFHRALRARDRELAAARLAESDAHLAALRAQLHPHFLFNALNAIAALMHHDLAAADRMLTRLSALLRTMLEAPAAESHTLAEELALLDGYLDVMQVRFGDRLRIERAIDPDALPVMVPWLVLQPLVENALEHGLWPRPGLGTLRVAAQVRDGVLRLSVEDDGTGAPDAVTTGVGLSNTRRRIAGLHGSAARLTVARRDGGGTTATVLLPLRDEAHAMAAP
jgi:signal transduction histidine kinase